MICAQENTKQPMLVAKVPWLVSEEREAAALGVGCTSTKSKRKKQSLEWTVLKKRTPPKDLSRKRLAVYHQMKRYGREILS